MAASFGVKYLPGLGDLDPSITGHYARRSGETELKQMVRIPGNSW